MYSSVNFFSVFLSIVKKHLYHIIHIEKENILGMVYRNVKENSKNIFFLDYVLLNNFFSVCVW